LNNDKLSLSYLLFEDDTLIFCHLGCFLLCFEVVSRLKINLAKSKLVPIDPVENVEGLTHIQGWLDKF
jgi:hypothetical protein